MRRMFAGFILAALSICALTAEEAKKIYSNDYLGKELPVLEIGDGHFFNAEKAPSLKAYAGRVVYVEFSFTG